MVGRTWGQELEAAGHTISIVRKQREMNADAKLGSVSVVILNLTSMAIKTDYHILEFLYPAPSISTGVSTTQPLCVFRHRT